MKRFYKIAQAIQTQHGFQLMLDGKPAHTPLKNPYLVPSQKLAEAVAAEWDAQGENIDKAAMPLTGYVAVAIDIVPVQRPALITEILAYAQTDLLCYRAEEEKIAHQQAELFDPHVKKIADIYGIKLHITKGVMPVAQPLENEAIIKNYAEALDDYHFAGLMVGMQTLSSLFLAMLLKDKVIDKGLALRISRFDEMAQAEKWGVTDAFLHKQQTLQKDIASLVMLFNYLRE